jgi:hypothetical protein
MPQALFVLPPTASNSKPASLQPVAIRLKNDGPLFYPNDPNWLDSSLTSVLLTYQELIAPKQYSGGWKFFRGRETAHLQMYVACLFYLHIDFVIFDPRYYSGEIRQQTDVNELANQFI